MLYAQELLDWVEIEIGSGESQGRTQVPPLLQASATFLMSRNGHSYIMYLTGLL